MNDRTAPAAHPIHELIAQRWSPRAFSGAPVTAEQTVSLLEAGRWASSCFNEQPWVFITARADAEPEAFAALLGLLGDFNQAWAKRAGLLVISFARLNFAANGNPNAVALYDLGQSCAQMALQAVALGLVCHQMRGFDVERARGELGVPAGHDPVSALAFGHLGEPSLLSEANAAKEVAPRTRKPIGDFASVGRFGVPVTV